MSDKHAPFGDMSGPFSGGGRDPIMEEAAEIEHDWRHPADGPCTEDCKTIRLVNAELRDAIDLLEGRDDWQGRALAAEAAAEGYQQRAERAEAAQREAVKAFQRERARVGRVEEWVGRWSALGVGDYKNAAGTLREALADGPTDD